jgi:hypothetical protein
VSPKSIGELVVLTVYDFRIGSDQECLVIGIRLHLVGSMSRA